MSDYQRCECLKRGGWLVVAGMLIAFLGGRVAAQPSTLPPLYSVCLVATSDKRVAAALNDHEGRGERFSEQHSPLVPTQFDDAVPPAVGSATAVAACVMAYFALLAVGGMIGANLTVPEHFPRR